MLLLAMIRNSKKCVGSLTAKSATVVNDLAIPNFDAIRGV